MPVLQHFQLCDMQPKFELCLMFKLSAGRQLPNSVQYQQLHNLQHKQHLRLVHRSIKRGQWSLLLCTTFHACKRYLSVQRLTVLLRPIWSLLPPGLPSRLLFSLFEQYLFSLHLRIFPKLRWEDLSPKHMYLQLHLMSTGIQSRSRFLLPQSLHNNSLSNLHLSFSLQHLLS
jgi:hypothetical protein